MNKSTKTRLIIASCLIALGVVLFIVVMSLNGWNFKKLGTVKYETEIYEFTEDFSDISFNTTTADLLFAPADDGKCKVVCYEAEHEKHAVGVKDGALSISCQDERKWYEYVGFSFDSPKITVYLPKGEYGMLFIEESTGDVEIPSDFLFSDVDISLSTGDVRLFASATANIKIKTTTGSVRVENTAAESLSITVTTGNVALSNTTCTGDITLDISTGNTRLVDIRCTNLTSEGSTGDLSLKNVVASGKLSAERSTGDIDFERCDAAEILLKTSTGDVQGSFLSPKTFQIRTSTGDVDVPSSSTGGKCEVTTSTGDVTLRIA